VSCKIKCAEGIAGGLARAHCGVCHETFSRVSNFDQHRVAGQCVAPESVGLVRKGSVWLMPPAADGLNPRFGTSGMGSASDE
jgi:hypothetical protein